MEATLDIIRIACSDTATAEQKEAGTTACRAVLAALENGVVAAPAAASSKPAPPPLPAVGQVTPPPADQLLDVVIARLRSMLPADAHTAASAAAFRPALLPVRRRTP